MSEIDIKCWKSGKIGVLVSGHAKRALICQIWIHRLPLNIYLLKISPISKKMFNQDEGKIECAVGYRKKGFWQDKKAEIVLVLFLTLGFAVFICLICLSHLFLTHHIGLNKKKKIWIFLYMLTIDIKTQNRAFLPYIMFQLPNNPSVHRITQCAPLPLKRCKKISSSLPFPFIFSYFVWWGNFVEVSY